MRKKTKDWVISSFSLNPEIKEKIEEISKSEAMSQTEFLEFIVNNWESSNNPTERLINLNKERETLKEKMNLLDGEIKKTTEHLKLFETWKKQKYVKKSDAIKVLQRVILNKNFEKAEQIAKTWQRMTGIPAIELLIEAKEKVEKSGV